MLFLIDIQWHRRKAESDRAKSGKATYAENARSLAAAKNKAVRKFNRHFGMHLAIDQVAEKPDPAGIFS
jgi:hypothetical protein